MAAFFQSCVLKPKTADLFPDSAQLHYSGNCDIWNLFEFRVLF